MSPRDFGTWILLGAGFPLSWASVVLHLRTPWRDTEMGRHLLLYSVAFAAVMTFAVLYRLTDGAGWIELPRAVTYVVLTVAMGWRVCLQVRGSRTPA
jgi:hypothetical protein